MLVPYDPKKWIVFEDDPEGKQLINGEDADDFDWDLLNWDTKPYEPDLPQYPSNAQLAQRQQDRIWDWLYPKPKNNLESLKRKPDAPLVEFDTQPFTVKKFKPYAAQYVEPLKINTNNFPYTRVAPVSTQPTSTQPLMSMDLENEYLSKWKARKAAGPLIRAEKAKYAAQKMMERAAALENYPKLSARDRFINKLMYRRGRRYKRKYRRYRKRFRRYSGRGAYYPSAGTNLGGRIGGYLGATAGEYLGNWGGRIIGLGDYSVRSNVFQGRLPEVTNLSGNGGTIIRFQEYLGDVITSATPGAFKIDTYMLNAANQKTFPWLSQVAANYDQYEIQGILFNFRSTSANALNSTNTALGTVMFATQYDVVDAPFSSKTEMLNYEFSTSSVPSQDQTHMVECDPHQTPLPLLFTDAGDTNPANTDPRLYFLGRTAIATTGFQGASVNIGELHVTYQVKLLKPKLVTALGLTNDFYQQIILSPDALFPLGTSPTTVQYDNFDADITATGTTLIFHGLWPVPKRYFVDLYWSGTVNAAIAFPSNTPSNGATVDAAYQIPQNGVSSQRMNMQMVVNIAANSLNPQILFAGAAVFPTGTLQNRIRITELPVDAPMTN
jgi:hypothetical protein